MSREAVEEVIASVQDFVRDSSFTQKKFFSDSGVAMLKDAVVSDGWVIVSKECNRWSVFEDGGNQQVVSDLQSCQEKVVWLRKASRDTSKRLFEARSAGPPATGTTSRLSGVRISNIVVEGQVEYVAVPEPAASSSRSVKSPVIGSKRKTSVSSGPMCRKHFEVTSPRKSYVDNRCFSDALDRGASESRRRSGRDRQAPHIFMLAKRK